MCSLFCLYLDFVDPRYSVSFLHICIESILAGRVIGCCRDSLNRMAGLRLVGI